MPNTEELPKNTSTKKLHRELDLLGIRIDACRHLMKFDIACMPLQFETICQDNASQLDFAKSIIGDIVSKNRKEEWDSGFDGFIDGALRRALPGPTLADFEISYLHELKQEKLIAKAVTSLSWTAASIG